VFNLELKDVYATNLFPFIKRDKMDQPIPMKDLVRAANSFGLRQIEIVDPKLVICLGLDTFNALRIAREESPCKLVAQAIESPFTFGRAGIWCQAHTGFWGQRNRGEAQVKADWQRMKRHLG
jgi:uracil-DNA glycosylase